MEKEEFKKFFEPYSKNVDSAKNLYFWKFSDLLIKTIIRQNIADKQGQIIMDAGGGTGRWICELAQDYSADFVLYDLSEDMIEQAKKNIAHHDLDSRIKLFQGNLTDMSAIPGDSIDNIISIYSPISFVDEVDKAFSELHRVLKKDGKLIIMGHGYYNALYSKINNYQAPGEELREMEKNYTVKWGDHVPLLNTFSRESMERLLSSAGFEVLKTYGVPIFVQPGPEDFDPENKLISRISTALSNESFFNAVFELEMKYNADPSVVNRGMNIFSVCTK